MKKFLYNDSELKQKRKSLRFNQTEAEKRIWQVVRNRQLDELKFLRQYSVGSYILDFYCPAIRLAIEIDGGQHATEQTYDKKRTAYLRGEDIRVIRFWNNEVLENIEGVVEKIKTEIHNPLIPPYLKGEVQK